MLVVSPIYSNALAITPSTCRRSHEIRGRGDVRHAQSVVSGRTSASNACASETSPAAIYLMRHAKDTPLDLQRFYLVPLSMMTKPFHVGNEEPVLDERICAQVLRPPALCEGERRRFRSLIRAVPSRPMIGYRQSR